MFVSRFVTCIVQQRLRTGKGKRMSSYTDRAVLFTDVQVRGRFDVALGIVGFEVFLDAVSYTSGQREYARQVVRSPNMNGDWIYRFIISNIGDITEWGTDAGMKDSIVRNWSSIASLAGYV